MDKANYLLIVAIAGILTIGGFSIYQESKYEARLASCRGPIFKIPLTKQDIGSYQAVTSDMQGQIYMMEPYVPPSKRFVMKNADGKVRKERKKK